MAEDEIERLLREVEATNTGKPAPSPSGTPAKRSPAEPAPASGGGRLAFAVLSGVGMGAVSFGVGAFLWLVPFINPSALDMGFGGAIAGFLTALLAGPPRWFSS
jgi:hypothetical protein